MPIDPTRTGRDALNAGFDPTRATPPPLLGIVEDEFGDVQVHRHADGSVVLWAPDAEWSTTFTPEQRDKLRELLDRAAMPGQSPAGASEPAYDPAIDNCGGMPGCGDQRVLFTWFHSPAICCPRCYENVFGAAPEPASVITLPDAMPGVRADGEPPAGEAREHG